MGLTGTAGDGAVQKVRTLKRYANRRLYDAGTSTTVTLEDVARFVREGEEVRVIDNSSGEDLTVRVLGQTFLKIATEERGVEFGAFFLSSLIREASDNLSGLLLRLIQAGVGTSQLTPEHLERIVADLVRLGEVKLAEQGDLMATLRQHLDRQGMEFREKAREAARQLSGIAPGTLEELSGRLEEMARIIKTFGK